jgi:hypothetical protein
VSSPYIRFSAIIAPSFPAPNAAVLAYLQNSYEFVVQHPFRRHSKLGVGNFVISIPVAHTQTPPDAERYVGETEKYV